MHRIVRINAGSLPSDSRTDYKPIEIVTRGERRERGHNERPPFRGQPTLRAEKTDSESCPRGATYLPNWKITITTDSQLSEKPWAYGANGQRMSLTRS